MQVRTAVAGVALSLALTIASRGAAAGGDAAAPATAADERPVDLCLCLDTSNSMDGLIDAARRRLWDVVNELSHVKPVPHLRVALLSYGNNGYPKDAGWVATDSPFTEDLDFISQKLFALRTLGGEEYVARVLDTALDRLKWSDDPRALRIVLVAGNESADQDRQVGYREVCGRAANRGIIVNSIYCGNPGDDIAPGWRDVAKLGEGEFAAIDQDRCAPVVTTPYDALLATLSTSYNATCLPFGRNGAAGCSNQSAQDGNATALDLAAAASRAATKASSNYCGRNGSWDLVDAVNSKDVDLAKLADDELPEAMRKLTVDERVKYVESMTKQRAEIQKQIAELDGKRREHIAAEMKKRGLADDDSLAGAVTRAVRAQAERKGFAFGAK
jgi:hypothetical protein